MIEIIYDKDKHILKSNGEEKNGGEAPENEIAASDEKKTDKSFEDTQSKAIDKDVKLPKNIRQIGAPNLGKRIYIEDYVVTYLNYLSRPGSTQARGAILLGNIKKTELGDIIFISGAVDAQNIEFDMDESEFTEEAWNKIYEEIKTSFSELSIVGWFLSRMGFSTAVNDKIEKLHVDNFPGRNKVLFITDSLESEDAFYIYEKGQLVKQKGYFIYYTKNEQMQNYIIKQKGGITKEQDGEIHRKDEELISKYRSKNNNARKSSVPSVNFGYLAASFGILAVLALGVTVLSNNEKMKEMETSINRLQMTTEQVYQSIAIDEGDTSDNQTATNASAMEDSTPSDAIAEATTEITTAEVTDTTISTTESDVVDGQENEITTEQTLPAVTDGNPTYYEVQYGDTLGSIADEMYGSVMYSSDIAAANSMNIDDKIYEGQQLLIPSINVE